MRRRESRSARFGLLGPRATEGLTREQSAAFSLHLAGWTYLEVARELDVGIDAARDRVRRAWVHVERDRSRPDAKDHGPLPPIGPHPLNSRQRRIHALWNAGGYSYRDISRAERLSLNACKVAIHRIRRTLGGADSTAPPSPVTPPGQLPNDL